jgi:hypothetical protein
MSGSKSQWAVSEDAECHVFCRAEISPGSGVARGTVTWFVSGNSGEVFGREGERLARFLPPSPGATDWHGHPVGVGGPSSGPRKPPKEVIAAWEAAALVSRATAKKIRQETL